MHILINLGEVDHSFDVTSDTLVGDLKAQISQKTRVNKNDIDLKFNSVFLIDDKPLSKYYIVDNSILVMIQTMRIKVKNGNQEYTFEVKNSTVFGDLKSQISQKTKVESSKIKLEFNGTILNDNNETLSNYGIVENSILVMSEKMRALIKHGEIDYPFEVTTSTLVGYLKTKISQETGVNKNDIDLKFNTVFLLDDKPLIKYHIVDNSILVMIQTMRIKVKNDNQEYALEVKNTNVIGDLKSQISQKTQMEISKIKLEFNGSILNDSEKTLSKYGIVENSILYISKKIQILVKFGTQINSFDVTKNTVLSDLISQISKKTGVACNTVKLEFNGEYLQNTNAILNDLGIGEGSSLIMMTELRGGY